MQRAAVDFSQSAPPEAQKQDNIAFLLEVVPNSKNWFCFSDIIIHVLLLF